MKMKFEKLNGLIPAVVQDDATSEVLMVGFMNEEALAETRSSGKVTFYSRSREKIWTKGETSGNFLKVKEIIPDCDADTLLIKALPSGPVCHSGDRTCFGNDLPKGISFLSYLQKIIKSRKLEKTTDSYTASLFEKGLNRIAQKVGEEAVETVIAGINQDKNELANEAADLMYHLLVLLEANDMSLDDVTAVLQQRHLLNSE